MTRPILTIDLEEWFHLLETDAVPDPDGWGSLERRLHANTDRLLDLFDRVGVKATFFVLGWIADRHPDVVRQVADRGHELGCHSHLHSMVCRQAPADFREETVRAIAAIQAAGGTDVTLYRAPGFSITPDSAWAFEVLAGLGIDRDASCFPSSHAHGGMGDRVPAGPFRIHTQAGDLKEFPVALARFGRIGVPIAGGGYFRLLPFPLVAHFARQTDYLMTYFHPRDFDPDQPRLQGLPLGRRFKSYVGLGGSLAKLEKLLKTFGGQSVGEADRSIEWSITPLLRPDDLTIHA